MSKVKKIKILQYAKVQGVVMAFAGILAGILYSGLGALYDARTGNIGYGTALAFIAIPLMPLYFGAFGFMTGIFGAYLYNKATKWFSGIEMDIKE